VVIGWLIGCEQMVQDDIGAVRCGRCGVVGAVWSVRCDGYGWGKWGGSIFNDRHCQKTPY